MKINKFYGPLAVIIFGVVFLLIRYRIFPAGQALITIGFFVLGGYFWIGKGITKDTFIPGGFFIFAGICSILRTLGYLGVLTEVPLFIIMIGILWFINKTNVIKDKL
jgi:hypothetical protein